jgi:HD-GYP domain-containing protein (c-di-GMP phosphodiesterase class II)
LLETTKESTQFFEENKENNEKISALQNGLVLVLADMVENRDGSTGDHVRKTAAYVNLTAKKMQELGYYKDKLTDQFIDDITRSAPLHDIGKIAIPDAVLNAPRKLTDEEFEIMKTHAARGREVIEQVIASIPDADYLEEAKNVAGYHHEKWNGKGYPEGLAGEDIPLAARIMAVADVFDALTSPRVYKPAFPLEKALSIIEEGKGTQFDPKCVEVFMDSLDEVMVILNKYNKEA